MTNPNDRDPAELWITIDSRNKTFAISGSGVNARELLRLKGMESNGRAVCYVPKSEFERVKAELAEAKADLQSWREEHADD